MTAPGLLRSQIGMGGAATAWLSRDEVYRYRLTRTWDTERPADLWVMLNPSTADALVDDPTIRRCISFTQRWGGGGIVVVNLFALRSTDPANLAQDADPVGPDNDTVIVQAAARRELDGGRVIAAWGAHPMATQRAKAVAQLLAAPPMPVCLGTTKAGSPRHPLYVKGTTVPVPWVA